MNLAQKTQTLEMLPKMKRIDAIQCAWQFQADYKAKIDWHEFSYYLEELRAKGILKITQGSGMTQYTLNI